MIVIAKTPGMGSAQARCRLTFGPEAKDQSYSTSREHSTTSGEHLEWSACGDVEDPFMMNG